MQLYFIAPFVTYLIYRWKSKAIYSFSVLILGWIAYTLIVHVNRNLTTLYVSNNADICPSKSSFNKKQFSPLSDSTMKSWRLPIFPLIFDLRHGWLVSWLDMPSFDSQRGPFIFQKLARLPSRVKSFAFINLSFCFFLRSSTGLVGFCHYLWWPLQYLQTIHYSNHFLNRLHYILVYMMHWVVFLFHRPFVISFLLAFEIQADQLIRFYHIVCGSRSPNLAMQLTWFIIL